MPQLNPGPWFMTFLLAWLTYMTIFLLKTQTTSILNTPTPSPSPSAKLKTNTWIWPWP
uniref:ATP synthase complex subunit 8 n=1 Tax=Elgaria kingii TaxID=102185 RepID=H6VUH0_ELGKI|nr:ATPase8 [Elgaria kingii]